MNYIDGMSFAHLDRVYGRLTDKESKEIFDKRLRFMVNRDWHQFLDLRKSGWKCSRNFEEWCRKHKRPLVIFGAGADGIYTAQLLEACGKPACAFCDTNRLSSGGELPVWSFEELHNRDGQYGVIISSSRYAHEIYEQCLRVGMDRDLIYYPGCRFLPGHLPHQYFDFFEPAKDEIFVDVGAYDGQTSLEFAEWADGKFEKIYLIEADSNNAALIHDHLSENHVTAFQVFNTGVWNEKATLFFSSKGTTESAVTENESEANESIEVTTIDCLLEQNRVSYIKMDIEGCEKEALEGASNTIRKYKPRLAISIYHKPADFIEIPLLILSICDNYKFSIRHYSSFDSETVLYAWCEGQGI